MDAGILRARQSCCVGVDFEFKAGWIPVTGLEPPPSQLGPGSVVGVILSRPIEATDGLSCVMGMITAGLTAFTPDLVGGALNSPKPIGPISIRSGPAEARSTEFRHSCQGRALPACQLREGIITHSTGATRIEWRSDRSAIVSGHYLLNQE